MSSFSTSSLRIVYGCLSVFLVLACTATPPLNTTPSNLTTPGVINDANFSVNSINSEPILLEKGEQEKKNLLLPETTLPAPYENWEDFYKDFFEGNLKSPEEDFSTKAVKPGAHYTIQSLTGSVQLGPGPFKIKDEGYVFNIPKTFSLDTMASTNNPHTFIQVKNGYAADTNKWITNRITIALKAAREKNTGDPKYAVRSWLQRDFTSADGITFTAVPNADQDKTYSILNATYRKTTSETSCDIAYGVTHHVRSANFGTSALEFSTPAEGNTEVTATGTIQANFGLKINYQRAAFYCPVDGGGAGGSNYSSSMNFVFKTELLPDTQIRCQKSATNSSEWYYDNISQVPKAFAVVGSQCQLCAKDEKQSSNNSGACEKACPANQTSTDHGETCVPKPPEPTPTPNADEWTYALWDAPRAPAGTFGPEVCQEVPTADGSVIKSCFSCPAGSSHEYKNGIAVGCKQGTTSENSFSIKGFNSHELINGQCEKVDY